ncbi:MAG: hypothetical protein R3E50_08990 [Halioglobus sp.]
MTKTRAAPIEATALSVSCSETTRPGRDIDIKARHRAEAYDTIDRGTGQVGAHPGSETLLALVLAESSNRRRAQFHAGDGLSCQDMVYTLQRWPRRLSVSTNSRRWRESPSRGQYL